MPSSLHAARLRLVLFLSLMCGLFAADSIAQPPISDPSIQFQFEELPWGTIDLFPGIDQPPPQFTSNGITLHFTPYQSTPGGAGSIEYAEIGEARTMESPQALFLIATNAVFDLAEANLLPNEVVHQVAFQLEGDGSGAPSTLVSMVPSLHRSSCSTPDRPTGWDHGRGHSWCVSVSGHADFVGQHHQGRSRRQPRHRQPLGLCRGYDWLRLYESRRLQLQPQRHQR